MRPPVVNSVRLWATCAFRLNPLVRSYDCAEAWFFVVALGALIVVSMAVGALGAAWVDVRSGTVTADVATGHVVPAERVGSARSEANGCRVMPMVTVAWESAGPGRVQDVECRAPAARPVAVGVGFDGRYGGTLHSLRVLGEAFALAAMAWMVAVAAPTGGVSALQNVIDDRRRDVWELQCWSVFGDRRWRDNST